MGAKTRGAHVRGRAGNPVNGLTTAPFTTTYLVKRKWICAVEKNNDQDTRLTRKKILVKRILLLVILKIFY